MIHGYTTLMKWLGDTSFVRTNNKDDKEDELLANFLYILQDEQYHYCNFRNVYYI